MTDTTHITEFSIRRSHPSSIINVNNVGNMAAATNTLQTLNKTFLMKAKTGNDTIFLNIISLSIIHITATAIDITKVTSGL